MLGGRQVHWGKGQVPERKTRGKVHARKNLRDETKMWKKETGED